MTTETITWTPIEQGPPDADTTVTVSLDDSHDEPTWFGFYDGETWRDVSGAPITGVLAWSDMPKGISRADGVVAAPNGELPFELPPGAVVEGYCIDPVDGLRYPYGSASDGLYWIADQFAWAGWRTREARDKVLAQYRRPSGVHGDGEALPFDLGYVYAYLKAALLSVEPEGLTDPQAAYFMEWFAALPGGVQGTGQWAEVEQAIKAAPNLEEKCDLLERKLDQQEARCARPGCDKPTAGPVLAFCKDHSAPPVPYA